jgi:hypothetical protein
MQPIVNIQKFADTPISNAAMSDLSRVRSPEARALDFPWDITSPDGIIAFFSAQMQSTDASLKKLMYSQEARNGAIKDIGLLNDLLAKYGDKSLMPGTDDFAEFQRLSAEITPALGGSADENSVRGALDVSLRNGHVDQVFAEGDAAGIAGFFLKHPSGTKKDLGLGQVLCSADDVPSGIDAATCKDISTKLKTIGDSYSQSNQTDMINVQNLVNRIGQITSLASNIVQKYNEAAMGPIGNIK